MAGGIEGETMAGMKDLQVKAKVNSPKAKVISAMEIFLDNLEPKKTIKLAEELEELIDNPGFGEMIIRVYENHITVIQITTSFK